MQAQLPVGDLLVNDLPRRREVRHELRDVVIGRLGLWRGCLISIRDFSSARSMWSWERSSFAN
jgi:hypothetical protein